MKIHRPLGRALFWCIVVVALIGPSSGTSALPFEAASGISEDVWVKSDREKALERLFLLAVAPQIQSAVAGSYRHDIQFDQEKVISIHHHNKYPGVLRVIVEVKTFQGAHNYVGVDHLEFTWQPGGLRLKKTTHQPYKG